MYSTSSLTKLGNFPSIGQKENAVDIQDFCSGLYKPTGPCCCLGAKGVCIIIIPIFLVSIFSISSSLWDTCTSTRGFTGTCTCGGSGLNKSFGKSSILAAGIACLFFFFLVTSWLFSFFFSFCEVKLITSLWLYTRAIAGLGMEQITPLFSALGTSFDTIAVVFWGITEPFVLRDKTTKSSGLFKLLTSRSQQLSLSRLELLEVTKGTIVPFNPSAFSAVECLPLPLHYAKKDELIF